jgi:hypothetical protein
MYSGKGGEGRRDYLLAMLGRLGQKNESIEKLAGREGTLSLVEGLLEDGDIEAAITACQSMRSASLRSNCWISIAAESHELGKTESASKAWQAARTSASAESFPRFRAESLCELAVALNRAGRHLEAADVLALARKTADSIADASERAMAQRDVCIAHADIGKCKTALTLVPKGSESEYTVREIVVHCAEPSELDVMREQALRLRYEDQRGDALGAIAAKLAASGQLARALADVKRIPRSAERVTALLAIAGSAKAITETVSVCP